MKRGLMLLMILLLLPNMGVLADAHDDDATYVVTVYVDSRFSQPSQQLDDLIDMLESALREQSTDLQRVILQIESDPDFAYIIVNLDLLADADVLFVDIDPIYPFIGVLPSENIIGQMYTEFPLAASPSDALWLDITVSVVLAMSHYLVGECETTLAYLGRANMLAASQEELFYLGQLEQTDAYLMFYQGVCLLIEEDYQAAYDIFSEIIALYDENGFDRTLYGMEVRLNLAWAAYMIGDVDTALDTIAQVMGTQFDWIELDALLMRARIYAETDQFDLALNDIFRAERVLFPDDLHAALLVAELRIRAGDLFGAADDIEQLEKTFPDWPELFYLRGLLARAEGDDIAALGYFYTYQEIEPDGYAEEVQAYIDAIESGR